MSIPLPLEKQIQYATSFFKELVSFYGKRRFPELILRNSNQVWRTSVGPVTIRNCMDGVKHLALLGKINIIEQTSEIEVLDRLFSKEEIETDNSAARGEVEASSSKDPRRVFVVHGRNTKAREAMFTFLRSIGLNPVEWPQAIQETQKPTPYIGEILDTAFSIASAVVVLMTPDDEGCLREQFRKPNDPSHEAQVTPQARLNVLFEAGMAMGRHPDRTVLVELGTLRPFSDIGGRHVLKLDNTTEKRQELAKRLENAKCPVDLSGTDWHSAGDFMGALVEGAGSRIPPTAQQTSRAQLRTRPSEWSKQLRIGDLEIAEHFIEYIVFSAGIVPVDFGLIATEKDGEILASKLGELEKEQAIQYLAQNSPTERMTGLGKIKQLNIEKDTSKTPIVYRIRGSLEVLH